MRTSIHMIEAACSAQVLLPSDNPETCVRGLFWDSREVVPGSCFLAFPGENVDGNDYVSSAIAAGAKACIVTREPDEPTLEAARGAACALLLVDDGIRALTALAGAYRGTLSARVVGVTGSSGKTTTKDFIASVLSQRFETVATSGNRNNELGVPATVLDADETTEALVVEMGMRGLGQTETLSGFVRPEVGVITNIGVSHMELLGSRENIARAKGELIAALPEEGIAVLPAEDGYLPFLIENCDIREGLTVVLYGFSEEAIVRATEPVFDDEGRPSFDLCIPGEEPLAVTLELSGRYAVLDALAAASVGYAFGMDAASIASGLRALKAPSGRGSVLAGRGGITVIDDVYNANPDSMRSSLQSLQGRSVSGRRVAVLGDMGELGEQSALFHREVGGEAYASGIELLVCIGEKAASIAEGAIEAGMNASTVVCFEDVPEALAYLENALATGDVVLVKASRSMCLERVVKGLVD